LRDLGRQLKKEIKDRAVGLGPTHRSMIDSFMCEYMWRNRVTVKNEDAFETFLRDISVFWPST